ncbi:MAG: hypothetical protein JNL39_11705, partial [Opitutaceae bacterium]|nr:hypothetical protein [Opitutaceae bacterium]
MSHEIRAAAGAAISQLVQLRGTNIITWSDIDAGFKVNGQAIKFASKAVGIFKPKELTDGAALSIKQVVPSRSGRTAPYDDRDLGSGMVAYSLEKSGRDNHLLSEAYKRNAPLIFFRGVADALYEVIFPVFVASFGSNDSEAIIRLSGDNEENNLNRTDLLNEPLAK